MEASTKRRRLDAEALRDSVLQASGELDVQLSGAGFRPTISTEALEGLSRKNAAWSASPESEQSRRGLYMYIKRGLLPPLMTTFDMCDASQTCGQRDSTTVPTQALALMNNRFLHDRSHQLATRIVGDFQEASDRIDALWEHVLGRLPTMDEALLAQDFLQRQTTLIERTDEVDKTSASNIESIVDRHSVLHLRGDRGVDLDTNGRVSQWQDLSTGGHDAQQATAEFRPMLMETSTFARPVVFFDSKKRFLSLSGSLLDDQTCTIIAVVTDQADAGHREIISNWNGGAGNSTTSLFLGFTGADTIRFSDARHAVANLRNRTRPFIVTTVNDAQRCVVRVNGREVSTGASLPPRNLTTAWVIGQQGNIGGEYWHGGIAELLVLSTGLGDEQLVKLEQHIAEPFVSAGVLSMPAAMKKQATFDKHALALATLIHALMNSNEFVFVD